LLEIKDIQSDDFSKNFPLRYYPRSIRVRTKRSFQTPARIVTETEYNQKKKFPNEINLDDHISMLTQYFNSNDLISFLNENGALKKLTDKVSAFGRPSTDSLISFLSLRPYKDKWTPLKEDQFSRFMRFMGIAETSLPTRSLPDIPLEFEHSKAFSQFCRQNEDVDKIIWLNIEEQDPKVFRKKVEALKELVKDGWLNVIGFYASGFSTVEKYNVNLDIVYTEFKDSEVLLIYEGAYKSFTRKYVGVSKLHYHPFEMFDAVSPYKHVRGGNNKKSDIEKIKSRVLFDESDVSLKPFADFDIDKLYSYSDNASRILLDEAFDIINGKGYPSENTAIKVTGFADIQQVIAGTNAMNDVGAEIRKNSTFDYLEEKNGLEEILRNKLGITNH